MSTLGPNPYHCIRTVSFWIEQLLTGVWGIQNVGGCWVSDIGPKRRFEENWYAVQLYSGFLNLFWTGMLLNIAFKLIFYPLDVLRIFIRRRLRYSDDAVT